MRPLTGSRQHFPSQPRRVPGCATMKSQKCLGSAPLVFFLLFGFARLSAQKLPDDYQAAERALAGDHPDIGRNLLQKLVDGAPPLPRAYERLAEYFIDTAQIGDGIAYFDGLSLRRHHGANAHAALALLWNAAGKANSALAHGLRAVLGGSEIFPACEMTVLLARAQAQDSLLRAKLQTRLLEKPDDLAAGYTLAYQTFAAGHLADAHNRLSTLQKRHLRDWRLFYLKAVIETETLPMDAVLSTIREGLAVAEAAADSQGVGCLLHRQVYCLLLKNDSAKATPLLKRLQTMPATSGRIKRLAALATASHQQFSGRFAPALTVLKSLQQEAMRANDEVVANRAWHMLGGVYYQMGNFAASEHAYRFAKSIADSLNFSTLQLSEEVGLGYTRERMGLYHYAKSHYLSAATKAQSIGSPQYLLYAWSGLARIHLQERNYQEAVALRKRQIILSRQLNRPDMEIDGLGELARLYMHSAKYDSADAAIEQALNISEKNKSQLEAFNLRLLQGDLQVKRANFALARKYYEEANAMTGALGNQAAVAANMKMGDLLLLLDDCAGAESAYRQAYEMILQRVVAEGLEKGQLDLATSSQALYSFVKCLLRCGKPREAFEKARQSRLLVLRALQISQMRVRQTSMERQSELARQIDSLRNELGKLAHDQSATDAQRLELQNKIERLEQLESNGAARQADSLWLVFFRQNPNPLPKLQKSLSEQKAVAIFYLVGDNATSAFALHPDSLVAQVIPGFSRDSLRALVRRINPLLVFDQNRPRSENLSSALQLDINLEAARQLMDAFVHPFLLGRRPEKLIIIPDDVLWALPFDALLATAQADDDNRAKPRKRRIDTLPQIQIALDFADMIPLQPTKRVRALLMANGQPVKSIGDVDSLPGLKLAVEEANKIAGLLPAGCAEILCNEHAAKDSFVVKAGKYGLLYLAMHARLSDWSPEYAQLFFGATGGASEPMYGYEISQQRLQAQLVVMSACNTALGPFRPGQGLLSFVLSFIDAGTPSVVASLWQVEEAATQKLMVEFCGQLRKGKTYGAALARAKQHLIDEGYSDPYYWAGFVLYGKDGQLDFVKSPFASAKVYAPILLGVSALFLLLWKLKQQKTLRRAA